MSGAVSFSLRVAAAILESRLSAGAFEDESFPDVALPRSLFVWYGGVMYHNPNYCNMLKSARTRMTIFRNVCKFNSV
jgi:hypothetical protein